MKTSDEILRERKMAARLEENEFPNQTVLSLQYILAVVTTPINTQYTSPCSENESAETEARGSPDSGIFLPKSARKHDFISGFENPLARCEEIPYRWLPVSLVESSANHCLEDTSVHLTSLAAAATTSPDLKKPASSTLSRNNILWPVAIQTPLLYSQRDIPRSEICTDELSTSGSFLTQDLEAPADRMRSGFLSESSNWHLIQAATEQGESYNHHLDPVNCSRNRNSGKPTSQSSWYCTSGIPLSASLCSGTESGISPSTSVFSVPSSVSSATSDTESTTGTAQSIPSNTLPSPGEDHLDLENYLVDDKTWMEWSNVPRSSVSKSPPYCQTYDVKNPLSKNLQQPGTLDNKEANSDIFEPPCQMLPFPSLNAPAEMPRREEKPSHTLELDKITARARGPDEPTVGLHPSFVAEGDEADAEVPSEADVSPGAMDWDQEELETRWSEASSFCTKNLLRDKVVQRCQQQGKLVSDVNFHQRSTQQPQLTEAEKGKLARKKLGNKIAARKSRLKKKQEQEALDQETRHLERRKTELKEECSQLQAQHSQLLQLLDQRGVAKQLVEAQLSAVRTRPSRLHGRTHAQRDVTAEGDR